MDEIDIARSRISISYPAKRNNDRTIPVKKELIDMLLKLPRRHKDNRVFSYRNADDAGAIFRRARLRAANKFGNPELLRIHFYSCRYWRATKERHQKGNPMQFNTYLDILHLRTFNYTQSLLLKYSVTKNTTALKLELQKKCEKPSREALRRYQS